MAAINQRIPLLLFGLLFWSILAPAAAQSFSAGPLWDQFPLTLSPGTRTEAAGPLFYSEQQEKKRTWAFPPLLSYYRDPDVDVVEFDLGYPILTYDRYGGQYRWQLFQLLNFSGGPTQTETVRNRFTVFPVFFHQRSSDPKENYAAYGPFYGHLHHRLFRDEISYVMFPGYSKTRKRDVITQNYVFPFVHVRHGDGLYGWQFWPFVGSEHKEVTTRTNSFGDPLTVPGHDDFYVMWPFYFVHTAGSGTANESRQHGIIPAYTVAHSRLRDSRSILWPLYSHIDDREKGYREVDAPWPLVEFARGPGKHTTRVFPFFSHASNNTNLESDFFLWPVYKYNHAYYDVLDRKRTRIMFYLYSDSRDTNRVTGASDRRVDLWPLFTWKRHLNGSTRLQVLAPLEPFVPGSHKIERDYSPLWSIWRAEHNAKTGAQSQSLLWNFYRRDKQPDSKKVSFFFGLYQSEAKAGETRKKIFFIPLTRARPSQGVAP